MSQDNTIIRFVLPPDQSFRPTISFKDGQWVVEFGTGMRRLTLNPEHDLQFHFKLIENADAPLLDVELLAVPKPTEPLVKT